MKSVLFCFISLLSISIYSQDWPNLNRYKEANYLLQEDNERVIFIGNSITEGWSTYSPEFFKNPSFINRGISGQTTPQMLLRFQQDVIDLNPKSVVILAGINDIAENTGPIGIADIASNINAMVILAKSNNINIFLCSVLPANIFPWRKKIKPADKVIELNKRLKDISENQNVIYVDFYSEMVNNEKGLKDDLGYDGVHPNAKGYAIMESVLNQVLNKPGSSNIDLNKLPDPYEAGWNGKKVCKVLKEDVRQRILKCSFPPNVGHEKHYHKPHFGYALKGGTFKITDAAGTKTITIEDGTTWEKDNISIHEVQNVGKTTSEYLIIENKN